LAEKQEIDFVEISAKSGENITDLFTEISKTLCQDFIPEDKID
jgi:translation initiation factor IF-2